MVDNSLLEPNQLDADTVGIIEFTLGGQHYGIDIKGVVEILLQEETTDMPNSNAYVEGIFKSRNEVVTVIDLAKYLNIEKLEESTGDDVFIITNFKEEKTAFHVHEVLGLRRIARSSIKEPNTVVHGGDSRVIDGIAYHDEHLIIILNFANLLEDLKA